MKSLWRSFKSQSVIWKSLPQVVKLSLFLLNINPIPKSRFCGFLIPVFGYNFPEFQERTKTRCHALISPIYCTTAGGDPSRPSTAGAHLAHLLQEPYLAHLLYKERIDFPASCLQGPLLGFPAVATLPTLCMGVQKCPHNKKALSALEFSVQGVPAGCLPLPLLFALFKSVQKGLHNAKVMLALEFSVQGFPAGCRS